MYHYDRTYRTARAVFAWLEFVGWALVVLGALAALMGFATGGIGGSAFRNPPVFLRLMSMLPGLFLLVFGLFSVAWVQSARAGVDSAEMGRQSLELLQKQASGNTVANSPSSNNSVGSKLSAVDSKGVVKRYRGWDIKREDEGFRVGKETFSNVIEAEKYIDSLPRG